MLAFAGSVGQSRLLGRHSQKQMTIRRIAANLGVSPSTVSLALRESPKIPRSTRERVRLEAERLGYRPDARLTELMSHLRLSRAPHAEACFGVISFYDTPRPWERSLHLSRIYESMLRCAHHLGYRLEPIWLHAPGMNYRRFREVLDARGIHGLLCFGSPNIHESFPSELDHYAIVTVGLSIETPLHRITSHFYSDLWRTLVKVQELGYRRPGLVLGVYEDDRSAHAFASAYFGWCEHTFGRPGLLPLLRLERLEESILLRWLGEHHPDVIVFVHLYDFLPELVHTLSSNGIRVPEDLGVAAVSHILEGTTLSGMQQNQELMGAWAVELLVARIMHQDLGIPTHPRMEMVESEWVDGKSL